MTKVIKSTKPPRDWDAGFGPMKAIDGEFADGEQWSINCKPGNETKIKADLDALIGRPIEGFSVEPMIDKNTGKQREYQGKPKWTLKVAQQQGGGFRGGGGGKGWSEAYSQSKEAHALTQRSIQLQVALKCACEVSIAQKLFSAETILDLARSFAPFLMEGAGAATTSKEDDLAGFLATIKSANAERKSKGLGPADATVVAAAVDLRGWKIDGFRSWSELHESLGPTKFKQLTKAIDLAPTTFEKETRREEQS